MGDYDLDTNVNTMNVQFCNGKDHQDFQDEYRWVMMNLSITAQGCKVVGIQLCSFEIMHF